MNQDVVVSLTMDAISVAMKIAVPMPSGTVIAIAMPTWISEPSTAAMNDPASTPTVAAVKMTPVWMAL